MSFLETGRSQPSREMVLLLASAMDLPLRERNALLHAAGFAPAYAEAALDGAELAMVWRALDHLLEAHEPFGAIVVDRAWRLVRANRGASRLLSWAAGGEPLRPDLATNALRAFFHPEGLRGVMVNWQHVASVTLARLQHELRVSNDPELDAIVREIASYEGVKGAAIDGVMGLPVVSVHLRRGDTDVRLFTTITSLGTPLDVTAQEVRIESYFPADEATERFLVELAEHQVG